MPLKFYYTIVPNHGPLNGINAKRKKSNNCLSYTCIKPISFVDSIRSCMNYVNGYEKQRIVAINSICYYYEKVSKSFLSILGTGDEASVE